MDQLPAPDPLRARHRRHLRQRRPGAGDDLPGDPPGELRAGRDGDVRDLPRLGADPGRRAVLGRLRDHRRRRLRARRRDRARRHPAGRERADPRVVIVFIAPAGDLQQPRRLDLQLHDQAVPEPVPRRSRCSATRTSPRTSSARPAITLVVLLLLFVFFRFTPLGLAMRAAAQNPVSSRLVGIRVGWMLTLGWGLAAAIGAVRRMMVAPTVFLEPQHDGRRPALRLRRRPARRHRQPGGAVIGGFLVGVLENLVAAT